MDNYKTFQVTRKMKKIHRQFQGLLRYTQLQKVLYVFEKQLFFKIILRKILRKNKSLQLLKDCTVSQMYFWNFSKHFIAVFPQNIHKMLLLSKCMKHRIERFCDQICFKQCNLKVQLFWPHLSPVLPPYRNQPTYLYCRSTDCFLCELSEGKIL